MKFKLPNDGLRSNNAALKLILGSGAPLSDDSKNIVRDIVCNNKGYLELSQKLILMCDDIISPRDHMEIMRINPVEPNNPRLK